MVPTTSLALRNSQLTRLAKAKEFINVGAFNVRTLAKIGHHVSLAITLNTLNIDICCVSETRIQNFSIVVQLSCLNSTRKFFLYLSGDDTAAAVGVGIGLSNRVEMTLLNWIPVNSHPYAASFSSLVKYNQNRSQNRTLFIVSL